MSETADRATATVEVDPRAVISPGVLQRMVMPIVAALL